MGKLEALREDALGAWTETVRYFEANTEDGETLEKADQQREFDKLMGAAQAKQARFRQFALSEGLEVPEITARTPADAKTLLDQSTGLGKSRNGLPFPTSNGSAGGILTRQGREVSIQADWGDAFVKGLTQRGGFKAELVDPSGSLPVTVPVRTQPVLSTERVAFLRQLMPNEPTGADGRFQYWRQTVRTNNAAVVPDYAKKPTSSHTMEPVEDKADTIAHLSEPIPRNWLSDASMLREFLNNELRYGLALALDASVVSRILADTDTLESGTGPMALPVPLSDLRGAITSLEVADYPLSGLGFVMSPVQWELVEATALSEFSANPALNPTDAVTRRLFGIPVVTSTALNGQENAILGDFRGSSILFLREEARIDWSENVYDKTFNDNEGASDFERNLVRFRAEMRAKFVLTRAGGFVQIPLVSLGS